MLDSHVGILPAVGGVGPADHVRWPGLELHRQDREQF